MSTLRLHEDRLKDNEERKKEHDAHLRANRVALAKGPPLSPTQLRLFEENMRRLDEFRESGGIEIYEPLPAPRYARPFREHTARVSLFDIKHVA